MPGIEGHPGYVAQPYTEMARYVVEKGMTAAHVSRIVGLHYITVLRHLEGKMGLSPIASRLYRSAFPDMPGVPLKGRPRRFAAPLPIRTVPADGWKTGRPGWRKGQKKGSGAAQGEPPLGQGGAQTPQTPPGSL